MSLLCKLLGRRAFLFLKWGLKYKPLTAWALLLTFCYEISALNYLEEADLTNFPSEIQNFHPCGHVCGDPDRNSLIILLVSCGFLLQSHAESTMSLSTLLFSALRSSCFVSPILLDDAFCLAADWQYFHIFWKAKKKTPMTLVNSNTKVLKCFQADQPL